MEVKENTSSAGGWPSTYSLGQKDDDGLYRLTIITFKFSFFSNVDKTDEDPIWLTFSLLPIRHGCNYYHHQSYKICFYCFISVGQSNGYFNVNFATDIQLIPVWKIGLIIQGYSYFVFATDIQLMTVRKMITFITKSCYPEVYRHHKCPMGSATGGTRESSTSRIPYDDQ